MLSFPLVLYDTNKNSLLDLFLFFFKAHILPSIVDDSSKRMVSLPPGLIIN